MLSVNHLYATYDNQPVLQDISLSIDEGELTVILGPSGSGKTTLLNMIAGFAQPDHGSITLDGQAVTAPGAERGMVFQHEGLLPWRNVLNNVAFGLQLQGVGKAERHQKARQMLQMVGLADYEKHFIWQLSGGMRQRVGIARALTANPRLLLLDEPFGALDAFTREQMQELLLSVWQQTKKRILLITHDIEEAIFLATDLLLLSSGPGQVVEHLRLPFNRQYCDGVSCREIKSSAEFIVQRESVLQQMFAQRDTTA